MNYRKRKVRSDRNRKHRKPSVGRGEAEHLWVGNGKTACGISCLENEAFKDIELVTCGRCLNSKVAKEKRGGGNL